MDRFFALKHCECCGGSLEGGRIMSRFNENCICMDCSDKEKQDPEYPIAVEAELAEIRKGNYNYPGLRG